MNGLEFQMSSGVPNPNAPQDGTHTMRIKLYECINGERVLIAEGGSPEVAMIRGIL